MLKEGTWDWAVEMMKKGFIITKPKWESTVYWDLFMSDVGNTILYIGKSNSMHQGKKQIVPKLHLDAYERNNDWKISDASTFKLCDH